MLKEANKNLDELRENPYPGRGIILGLDEAGQSLVQVYWIMGRSDNSRNRVFEAGDGRLWTEAADPTKVKDPSLIIYNAMDECGEKYFVTNGDQTDTLVQADRVGVTFGQALHTRQYEPDGPNYTPRISGVISLDKDIPRGVLSVLKRSRFGDGCDRHFFCLDEFHPGVGLCVTTYMGDGNPLPSFQGEPWLLPLPGSAADCAELLWGALNEENRVSLAVKFIDWQSGETNVQVINKYEKSS